MYKHTRIKTGYDFHQTTELYFIKEDENKVHFHSMHIKDSSNLQYCNDDLKGAEYT